MSKGWMFCDDTWCEEYSEGLEKFLEMAKRFNGSSGLVRCPCRNCRNMTFEKLETVATHLRFSGMDVTYQDWVHHGESVPISDDVHNSERLYEHVEDDDDDDDDDDDEMGELLSDLNMGNIGETFQNEDDTMNHDVGRFGQLFGDAKKELYPGCTKYSLLLFVVRILHLKVRNRWSNKSVSMLLELLRDSYPEGNLIPSSYYAAKKLLSDIGLGYESIHACKNDCILYRKEHEGLESCPQCHESRWKVNDGKGKKIPHKVLRHFPLIPRLQRLYISKKTAKNMRWHKEGRVEEEGLLSHPADGEAWKDFDRRYPHFAADPRNVRLAISSDGFNPFNNMSTAYSMWPVVVINYNMQPWEARKDAHFILSLLIPGHKSPGKEIDVYLQP